MKTCRACGIDVSKDTKNRHPLTGKDVCPTLTKFATSAVRSLSSPSGGELCLDVKKFEAGYVCQRCYRQLTTLHTLQKKLRDIEDAITSKVAKVASLLPTVQLQTSANATDPSGEISMQSHSPEVAPVSSATSSDGNLLRPTSEAANAETQPSTSKSPISSRKRAATEVPSKAERSKKRRTLEDVESAPTSSSKSPDVAVSLSA